MMILLSGIITSIFKNIFIVNFAAFFWKQSSLIPVIDS